MNTPAPLAITPPREDWQGHWVWLPNAENHRNAYGFFRQTFRLEEATPLSLAITSDSFYALYVDGDFVARGPARAALAYYSFDSLALDLAAGDHCLAVIAHHIGEENASVMTGRPGLLVDLSAGPADLAATLSSSTQWRCLPGRAWRQDLPEKMSHFGFWEERDQRAIPAGWMTSNFDDSDWLTPEDIGTPPCPPWPRLCPRDIPLPLYQPCEPQRLCQSGTWSAGTAHPIPAATVRARQRTVCTKEAQLPLAMGGSTPGDGSTVVVDFGRTVSGDVILTFADSTPGQGLDLSYDDLLDGNGWIDPQRSYAHLTDRYWLPGGACEIRTTFARGFRYIMLDLEAGSASLTGVQAIEETAPFETAATFDSSEPAFAADLRRAVETVRICTTDGFTDCPTRERVQWMEDLYMHSRVAACGCGDTAFLRRALFQGAQTTLPDGRINGFVPSERTNCAFASSSLVWLHLLVDYHLYSGDPAVEALLPTASRLLDRFAALQDAAGLVASWPAGQFWDWAPIEPGGCLLVTNAMLIWALERLAVCPALAAPLAHGLLAETEALREAAHHRFWDPARHLYRDAVPEAGKSPIYSQHANALAVLAGIAPAAAREALLRRITDPARLGPVPLGEASLKNDNRPSPDTVVPVGTLWFGHFLCQALFEAGLDTEALETMRALWSAWEGQTFPETRRQHGNTFLCHGWAAGPAWLLPTYVLGIQPTGPEWSRIRVFPHAGDLTHAAGSVPTPHGPVRVAWQCGPDGLTGTLEAPAAIEIEAHAAKLTPVTG